MADQTVTTSTRTWNDECKAADKEPEDKTVYEWSNGQKFKDKDDPYSNE